MLCRALDRCIADRRDDDVADVLECLAPPGPPHEEAVATVEPIVSLLAKLAALCRSEAFPSTSHGHHAPAPGHPGDDGGGSSTGDPQHEPRAWIAQALQRETVSAIELAPGSAHAATSLEAAAMFARRNGCRVSLVMGSDGQLRSLLRSELISAQRTHPELLPYFFLDEQQRYLCRRRAM